MFPGRLCVLVCLKALLPFVAEAAATETIAGRVRDASGAAIAKVEMDKDVAEEDEENEEGTEIIADNQENNTEAPQTENENPTEETENSDSEE